MLDVTFMHGTTQELEKLTGRKHHDVSGVLFGRTYDVPREPNGDGIWRSSKDSQRRGPIQWTSTIEGTIIGTGGHLHPGGLQVIVENYGSKENPCPDDGRGYGGTLLLKSDALFRNAPLSEDFQMEVSQPGLARPAAQGRPHPDQRHLREQGPRLVRRDDPRGHLRRRGAAARRAAARRS